MIETPGLQLADYHLSRNGEALRPSPDKLYCYSFADNGVFIRARREGLDACARVAPCDIRGLATVEPFVRFTLPRVPEHLTRRAFNRAREVCVETGRIRETLFSLIYERGEWALLEPEQVADASSVRPADPADDYVARATIELHSHHELAAFWSGQDDADETGFKLYAVIGRIFTRPTLRVRAGVFGHFHEVPAEEIFELPYNVRGKGGSDD